MELKYKNTDGICGFKKNHIYTIEISKQKKYYSYIIHAIYDVTEKEEVDLIMNCSSKNSIKYNFDIKDEINLEN